MNARFVKLYESILEWQHFKQSNYLQVFLYLLFNANYKNGYDRQGNKVLRGQVVISLRSMASNLEISVNTLSSVLKGLQESGEIKSTTDDKKRNYTLITIVNYNKYQCDKAESVAVGVSKNDTRTDTQTDTRTDTQTDTIQEVNKDRKIEDNNSLSIIRPTEFEIFLEGQNSLWFENTKVALREPSEEKIRQLIKRFSAEMIARDEQPKTENDLKKHFVSWCKIDIANTKKEEQRKQQIKTAPSNSPDKFARNISQKDFSKGFEKL